MRFFCAAVTRRLETTHPDALRGDCVMLHSYSVAMVTARVILCYATVCCDTLHYAALRYAAPSCAAPRITITSIITITISMTDTNSGYYDD